MALDTTLLKPAQIGTSEIATKNDITTSLGAYNPATVINTNTTTIDGGKITTGTITANQIAANTITSSQLTTGIALINGEVRSSDFSTIDGAGFRLKSNAAGTSADPTIYGAYIRGGVLEGTKFSLASTEIYNTNNTVNTGRFMLSYRTIVNNGTIQFVGLNYSSGFIANRCISNSQRFDITTSATFNGGGVTTGTGTITVSVSINGGAYSTVAAKTIAWADYYTSGTSLFFPCEYTADSANFSTLSFKLSVTSNEGILSSAMSIVTTNSI